MVVDSELQAQHWGGPGGPGSPGTQPDYRGPGRPGIQLDYRGPGGPGTQSDCRGPGGPGGRGGWGTQLGCYGRAAEETVEQCDALLGNAAPQSAKAPCLSGSPWEREVQTPVRLGQPETGDEKRNNINNNKN